MTETAHSPDQDQPVALDRANRRRALTGGIVGYFVDQFDIYLPVIVLAPAMGYFVPPGLDAGTTAIIAAFVFTATLLGRPVGAAIFGVIADRTGRRKATIIAIAGIAVTTLLIGLLPGYASVGLWGIALVILLRLVDGVFLGGEYTAAIPLAMEWTPKRRRGLASGLITMTSPGALCLISAMTLLLLQIFPAGSPDSAYAVWGWRIPFVIGALLAAGFLVYFVRRVPESEAWANAEPAAKRVSPLRQLFTGANRRSLGQVFVLMTGVWIALNISASVLPGLTSKVAGLTPTQLTVALIIASAVSAVTYPIAGVLSQRIGRRPFYIGVGLLVAVVGGGATALLAGATDPGFGLATLLLTVAFVVGILTFGPIAAYMTERFPAALRSTGYGIGYSLALVVPAFYAYYLVGLGALFGTTYASAILMAIGGLLVSVGAWLGPETRDVDMA
ncbi:MULTISPECIES: MFS transporter [Pseudonocardia]|uniref:Predicted arabinose efflux permease, MFS family n=1 Tax=Pseudonocardia oroxyli TaxID=366584 RepID=A0A1G7SMK1_PSEOR|nr:MULTISPECIES: MFS transporter [Pseudonocardia]MCF7552322.1 MFS transporter [Pseudonocardia sp. WMMC193]SDG24161.1 Predicted arabinose efflux permease, MFS family [Pseudonocardia oroxyli]